jgi:dTDP-4-amino-4,6-dideoxygalactose transaminase
MLDRMKPSVSALGDQMHERTHWLFAPMLDRPDDAIARLRAEGFDAARGTTSITALDAPHDRPELAPKQAIQAMKRVLFVPIYPEISQSDRDRLAAALSRIAERRAAVGPRPHDRGETP